jgi:hypothetical protein
MPGREHRHDVGPHHQPRHDHVDAHTSGSRNSASTQWTGLTCAPVEALGTRTKASSDTTKTGMAPHSLPDCPLPAVVVNPNTVEDWAKLHVQITGVCAELGWAPPLWLPTTVEDPGGGQARIALAAGADVVLACGGDGTVRHVAQVLAGSGTALGLVPTGTSNVLARNLAIGLDDPAQATRIALSGNTRAIDVGRVIIDGTQEQVFLVMAGMGFDAASWPGRRMSGRPGWARWRISSPERSR